MTFSPLFLTLLSILLSYLIGSVCFGILIAGRRGVNLREAGSGNIGSTNVLRVIGKKEGALTLAGDLLKGTIAVLLARFLIGMEQPIWMALSALAAIVGHNFPLYYRFRGGKGVATTFGVLLAYMPLVGLLVLLTWGIAVALTRISSVGALSAAVILPVLTLFLTKERIPFRFALVVSGMMVIRHRENIRRLLRGEEG